MTNICDYGCGNVSIFTYPNGKHCCSTTFNACPAFLERRIAARRKNNPDWVKNKEQCSANMSNGLKGKASWSKGQTKETNASLAEISKNRTGIPKPQSVKDKISATKKAAPLNAYQLLPKTDPKKAEAIKKQVEKQTGQTRIGNYSSNGYPGKLNPMYGVTGSNHPSYKHVSDAEALYRKTARNMTERNKKNMDLTAYKIGKAGVDGAYQVDHIISVVYGYENNIPVELIASIDNLQVIPWKENLSKKHHLTDKAKQLLNEWGY